MMDRCEMKMFQKLEITIKRQYLLITINLPKPQLLKSPFFFFDY